MSQRAMRASPCSAAASSAPRSPGCSPSRPTTSPPGSAPRWSWPASPCAGSGRERDIDVTGRAAHHRRRRPWSRRDDVDLVVEVIGGIEPARSLILAAIEHGASVVTANKALLAEDGADAVRARPRRPTARPVLRGRRRRRDPDPPAAARVAGRRPRAPRARHRQRHHQLHPRQDGHLAAPASPRRWRRPRRSGTPRPTRPPTSRASTPRPRPRSSPSLAFHTRVTAADVLPRGHHRGHRRRRRRRPARWAAWSSCWRSASWHDRRTARRSRPGCTRR